MDIYEYSSVISLHVTLTGKELHNFKNYSFFCGAAVTKKNINKFQQKIH